MLSRIPWGARIFALIWLAVAFVWPLREPLMLRIAQDNGFHLPSPTPTPPAPDDIVALSSDLYAQFWQKRTPASLQRWDSFAAKHPQAVWIRADRLRVTTTEGVFSPHSPKWMTPQVINAAIACARAGRKIEPDNGFWGWMEAIFAVKAGRKSEALDALQQAASAARWDDYNQDYVRRDVALIERRGPMLYEVKVAAQSAQLYPHLLPMRVVSKTFTDEGMVLLKRGDRKGAFRLLDVVLRAAQVVRKSSDTPIVSLMGAGIERGVWQRVAVSQGVQLKPTNYNWSDPLWQKALDAFGKQADQAGYPDQARLAPLEFQAAIEDSRSVLVPYNDNNYEDNFSRSFLGVPANTLRIGMQGAYLLTYLSLLAFAGALLWIWGKLWMPSEVLSLTRGEIVRSVNFTCWALICSLALLWYLRVGGAFLVMLDEVYGAESGLFKPREFASKAFPAIALLAWLLPIAWTTKRHYGLQTKIQAGTREKIKTPTKFSALSIVRVLLRIFLLVFCVMAFSSVSDVWNDTVFAFPTPLFGAALCTLGSLAIEVHLWRKGEARFKVPHPLAITFALVTLATLYFVANTYSLLWMLPALVFGGFVLTLWPQKQNEESRSPALDFFIMGATRSAGILAVTWSLLYLIGAFVVWPMRAQMNHQIDRMMTLGEREWRAQQTK